ncbi:MAG: hypothetical protein LBV33_06330 [Lachnospiraceae bacterium]|nr:hypothetical protein [Lachnospiraceae bacterium]
MKNSQIKNSQIKNSQIRTNPIRAGGEGEIAVNFRESMEAARTLSEIAHRLERITDNDLGMTLRQIAQSWEGVPATVLLNKGQYIYRRLKEGTAVLADTARVAERTARQIYLVEQQTAMMARSRWR